MTSNHNSYDIIYISHGGGPLPLLGDKSHEKMVQFLRDLPRSLKTPDEILVVSAHWEEEVPTIYSAANQTLLYDYYGFPPESYEIQYSTKGNPDLVSILQKSLARKGIPVRSDTRRGLDHGVFIPLKIMYPEGNIPVTQLSLQRGLNPLNHLELGRALRPLLNRNILIIGSGFSFHNMRFFTMNEIDKTDRYNDEFQDWLIHVCAENTDMDKRSQELENWVNAPHARYCHPREEHLLPLPCVRRSFPILKEKSFLTIT